MKFSISTVNILKLQYNCNHLFFPILSCINIGKAIIFLNYTRLAAVSDRVYQLLAQGRWFSSGTPASSTTKTGRHDIAEILLKVALNTKIHSFILYFIPFVTVLNLNWWKQSLIKPRWILVVHMISCEEFILLNIVIFVFTECFLLGGIP